MKSDTRGKPPGTSSYAIGVDLKDLERLEELAATADTIDGLTMDSVRFLYEENESDKEPVEEPLAEPELMGNPLADRIQHLLSQNAVLLEYPNPDMLLFWLSYQVSNEYYVIMDALHDIAFLVPIRFLLNERFNLVNWYRTRITQFCYWCGMPDHVEALIQPGGCDCGPWDWTFRGDLNGLFGYEPLKEDYDYSQDKSDTSSDEESDGWPDDSNERWESFLMWSQNNAPEDTSFDRVDENPHGGSSSGGGRYSAPGGTSRSFAVPNAVEEDTLPSLTAVSTAVSETGDDLEDLPALQEHSDDEPDGEDDSEETYQRFLTDPKFEPIRSFFNDLVDAFQPERKSESAPCAFPEDDIPLEGVRLSAAKPKQAPEGSFSALQRNAARTKDFTRKIPKPIVIIVRINGQPVRALLDSGSLGDFMSSALADQLRVKKVELEKPLAVQLAVQGSRTKVNFGTKVRFEYANITEDRYFDIVNVDGYDLILGTPFLFQHKAVIGFNETRILIGSDVSTPIVGEQVATLSSRAMDVYEEQLDHVREELCAYAAPLCKKAEEAELPPMRRINHRIPIIDKEKSYPYRQSRCPEAFRALWNKKRDLYLKTGRWRFAMAKNAAPLMFLAKRGKPGEPLGMRNTTDVRDRNANTEKVASPVPDQRGMLYRAASHKYLSALDTQGAYDCVRVHPDDVQYTAFNTPDGTMESLIMQQGDCNAVATFMAIMTDLFSAHIGVWMDVYLDDIVIYTDTLDEHVVRCKQAIDTLSKAKFYLSEKKLQFLPKELHLLGHIITRNGIRMDPEKVDSVTAWKVPTNRDLLRGFIGSVGYLADNVEGVRIPLDVLNRITGDNAVFRWGPTEQRAFEEVKHLVQAHRDSHRIAMVHGPDAAPVHLVTDGCISGIAGKISQGDNWKTAPVIAFFSAKLSPAQQNYAVHEIELLAGLETMMRNRDLLLGVRFTWYTDHRALEFIMNQRNLTGRQARWMEKMSDFDFEVRYVRGEENVLADALSRMYSADAPGTVRAASEYAQHDETSTPVRILGISAPVKTGAEARATMRKERVLPDTARLATLRNRPPPPTATKKAETSKEFAKRIKKVVLRVPERPEGGLAQANKESEQQSEEITAEPVTSEAPDPEFDAPAQLLDVIPVNGLAFPGCLRGRYVEDVFFKTVLARPKDFKNFSEESGLLYLRDGGRKVLCIPQCLIGGRSAREIIISHAHSILAHLGAQKTIAYLREQVWWKRLVPDVVAFVDSCSTCRRSKPSNQKPYGLLNPLAVPSAPWEAIGMDFVGPLPESSNRDAAFDMLVVVIDLLTGYVLLVPGRTNYKAKEMAELVFSEVYKRHGLPARIVSDRDVLFTSTFWDRLHKLLGVELRMSSAYHPETDGSTERANRTVTTMLRLCVNEKQTNWVSCLPAIEFAINSARSESTGFAPFFLNNGRMPRSMVWNNAAADEYPGVRAFAQKMKQVVMAAHDAILEARVKQTRAANRSRRPSPFSIGDFVYISTKNISFPKGRARKLVPKYIGPYKIAKDYGNNSYRVDLPDHLRQRGVHGVFHSSLMRVHVPNDDRLFPGRSEKQVADFGGDDSEWAADRILSHRGRGTSAIFEISWKAGDVSWLSYDSIRELTVLQTYLESVGSQSIVDLSEGRGQPPDDDPQVFAGSINFARRPDKYKRNVSTRTQGLHSHARRNHCAPCSHPYVRHAPHSCDRFAFHTRYVMPPARCKILWYDVGCTTTDVRGDMTDYDNSQLCRYWAYSDRLRKKKTAPTENTPLGHAYFAHILNDVLDAMDLKSRMTVLDEHSGKTISSGAPLYIDCPFNPFKDKEARAVPKRQREEDNPVRNVKPRDSASEPSTLEGAAERLAVGAINRAAREQERQFDVKSQAKRRRRNKRKDGKDAKDGVPSAKQVARAADPAPPLVVEPAAPAIQEEPLEQGDGSHNEPGQADADVDAVAYADSIVPDDDAGVTTDAPAVPPAVLATAATTDIIADLDALIGTTAPVVAAASDTAGSLTKDVDDYLLGILADTDDMDTA